MGLLGDSIRCSSPEEALPVLMADVALWRRTWPGRTSQTIRVKFDRDGEGLIIARSNVASCLATLGRHDEALVIKREIYASRLAKLGVSHEETIRNGSNLSG